MGSDLAKERFLKMYMVQGPTEELKGNSLKDKKMYLNSKKIATRFRQIVESPVALAAINSSRSP